MVAFVNFLINERWWWWWWFQCPPRICARSPRVYWIYGRPGRPDQQSPTQSSPIHWWHTSNCVNHHSQRRINRWPSTAVCRRDPPVVFVQTIANESQEVWIHLVWVTRQSRETGSFDPTSSLIVTRDVVQRANAVRDLGVILDSELLMQNHISKVTQTCFYHIRRLKQVRKLLGPNVAAKLVVSLVFSRFDYCNATLAGLPKSTIAPLQRVQNAAARLVVRLGPYDHVTATLKDRHWLPIKQRILFKLCVLMHPVHISLVPSYL